MDITSKWADISESVGYVTEMQEYTVDGVTYKVDEKHVFLSVSEHERDMAEILARRYGKAVALVPKVVFPQNIQTPDYLINGERFDLKTPTGRSANLLYNQVSKKGKQASNFIFDVTDCPLSFGEIERQVKGLYASRHTRFIDKIVVLKDGEILKVYARH